MKKRLLSMVILTCILVATCIAMPVCAEGTAEMDWASYSYDELLSMRENLDNHIKELERQYAIENGNRTITLNETELSIYQNQKYTFQPTVKRVVEDAPENTEFVWTSSDESVAKVLPTGEVIAVSYGDAVITCTAADDEYIFSEAIVHVVLPVTGLMLDSDRETLLLSEQNALATDITLNCTVEPENAYVHNVTWSSSDETIATVDENGNVHAVAPGTATITATSADPFASSKKAVCEITVLQAVSSIELNETQLVLNIAANQNLTAVVYPDNASKKTLSWESSNPEIASVSNNGRVSGLSTGTATITCKAEDGSESAASCEVTVIQMVNNIKIEAHSASLSINKGETATLNAVVSPEEATNKGLTWESSDTAVATVDNSGTVTAVSGGEATITCTAVDGSEKSASIKIYVPSIAVDELEYVVESKSGLNIPFKYYGKPENLTFTPEKCSFFTVELEQQGEQARLKILPDKAGSATVTLTDNSDKRSTIKLTITVDHSACYDSTSYPTGDYTSIMRTPSSYEGKQMSAYGRVLQVSQGLFSTTLRVATQGRWDNVFYITCKGSLAEGIIEGDYITIYGECGGTETYTTVLGSSVTIPSIKAEKIFLGRH